MSAHDDKPTANGREANGQFARHNTGGPGNPHGGHVARLRAALMARVTEGDIEAAAGQLVQLARDGSLPAIKLLFQYTLGKPSAMVDHDPPAPKQVPAAAPKPQPAAPATPGLLREIERALFQPGVAGSLVADTKRELGATRDVPRRR
jgi:hypothetical protein